MVLNSSKHRARRFKTETISPGVLRRSLERDLRDQIAATDPANDDDVVESGMQARWDPRNLQYARELEREGFTDRVTALEVIRYAGIGDQTPLIIEAASERGLNPVDLAEVYAILGETATSAAAYENVDDALLVYEAAKRVDDGWTPQELARDVAAYGGVPASVDHLITEQQLGVRSAFPVVYGARQFVDDDTFIIERVRPYGIERELECLSGIDPETLSDDPLGEPADLFPVPEDMISDEELRLRFEDGIDAFVGARPLEKVLRNSLYAGGGTVSFGSLGNHEEHGYGFTALDQHGPDS